MNDKIKSLIPDIATYFKGQPVLRAWLFGSCARGEETDESDIDLLVDYDKTHRISLLKVCGMMIDLEAIIGRRVDMVENGRLKDFATVSANNDKILIYERAI